MNVRPLILALAAGLLLAAGCTLPPDDTEMPPTFPPVVSLQAPNDSVSVNAHRGKVVLVYLWATWCAPCRMMSPIVDSLYTKFHDKGLIVMSISSAEPESTVTSFLTKNPKKSPVYLDPSGTFAKTIGSNSLPTVIVVDKEGEIAKKLEGTASDAEKLLEDTIRQML